MRARKHALPRLFLRRAEEIKVKTEARRAGDE
jgi:hypothetical protein